MSKDLTQTRIINNVAKFQEKVKGDCCLRLKYLMLRVFRNPVDKTLKLLAVFFKVILIFNGYEIVYVKK